jgi:hypothetical protein
MPPPRKKKTTPAADAKGLSAAPYATKDASASKGPAMPQEPPLFGMPCCSYPSCPLCGGSGVIVLQDAKPAPQTAALPQVRSAPATDAAPVPVETAAKSKRKVGIRWSNGSFAILYIANGTGADYFAEQVSATIHRLTKLEPGRTTTYTVRLEPASCTCDGHKTHQHCKHVEALQALREAGSLS